ncbi:MAG: site-2 protease family protein [Candidatus Asgardarchaeia archaeon]
MENVPNQYDEFEELRAIVEEFFEVREYYINSSEGSYDFIVGIGEGVKENFEALYKRLKVGGYLPILRRMYDEGAILRIIKIRRRKEKKPLLNIASAVATLATITISGWIFATSPVNREIFYYEPTYLTILMFVVSIFGITLIHELGHLISSRRHGVETSLPYFIPGLPQLGGTFGAVIIERTPPVNKDSILDTGITGPIFGFIASIIVTVIGISLSEYLTIEEYYAIIHKYPELIGTLPSTILFDFIIRVFQPQRGNMVLFLHPVAFAGWVGMLITGLNYFPAGQLDGGHVMMAIVGPENHRKITYISIFIMILMGYLPMALLVMLLSGDRYPEALDEVSEVPKWKKVLSILSYSLVFLCTPVLSFY